MEKAQIREEVDPQSPAYRKAVIWVTFTVLSLGGIGGACLGYKISGAEASKAEPNSAQQAPDRP